VDKRRQKAERKGGKCVNQAGRKFDTRGARQIFPDWPREVLTGSKVAVQLAFKCAWVGFVLRSL